MSAPNDLTSLADVKRWLGVASSADDALLASLITGVSQAILADLGRPKLLPAVYDETFDGGGRFEAPLRQWPVTQVNSCTIDGTAIGPSPGPGRSGYVFDAPDAAPPGAPQRLLYRGGIFPRGLQNVTIVYRAGYEVLGEPALVPMVAPFVVTAVAPFGPWVQDTGVSGSSGAYSVADGIYTFDATSAGQSITISYGYLPADIAQAACEWVADRYMARGRIGQSAKTLGGQETTSFIVKAMPDVVSRLLQPYRRVFR